MNHYPLRTEDYYPRNVWYIAARTDEIGRNILSRTIFDQPLIFFRTTDGMAVALSGLCPHRLMPLAHGRLMGDSVRCGYHGIGFDSTGACIGVPTQTEIPKQCRLQSYPIVERGGFAWIWMGNGEADLGLLPDFSAAGLAGEEWVITPNKVFHVEGRAQLVVDNLFDLTHVPFVHALGGQFLAEDGDSSAGEVSLDDPAFTGELHVADRHGRLVAWRNVPEAETPAPITALFPEASRRIRYVVGTEMFSPALINASYFDVWNEASDQPMRLNFLHGITPETATSTHLFFAATRNYRIEDGELSVRIAFLNEGIISQDLEVFRKIEPYARTGDTSLEISVRADAGGLQARRAIERMLKAEKVASG